MQTKSLFLHINGKDDKTPSLAPFVDLIKYRSTPSVEWIYKEEGERNGLYIQAVTEIAQGDQLYFTYGKATNLELLHMKGFIDVENPNKDTIDYKAKMKKKDQLLDIKKEKLGGT